MELQLPNTEQSACALLAQAKQESAESGEVVKLILSGTRRIDSWLIEQRIVPRLRQQHATSFYFSQKRRSADNSFAILLPLPDGGAFARSTSERWSVLERLEAAAAIQYIGYRYAAQDRWVDGFAAMLQTGDETPRTATPFEVAEAWNDITGLRPAGFEAGPLDEMEALGLKFLGRVFNSRGRLGL